ncbi:MAG: hypothetical protein NVSMB12_03320 [Acidimicrobiales bacterium]
MSLIWIAPAVLALVGTVVLAAVARRAAEEAAGLRQAVARFGELRPALLEVREGSDALRTRLSKLR